MTPDIILPYITRGPIEVGTVAMLIPPILGLVAFLYFQSVPRFRDRIAKVTQFQTYAILALMVLGVVGSMGLIFTPWARHITADQVSNVLNQLHDPQMTITAESIPYGGVRLTAKRLNEIVAKTDIYGDDLRAIAAAARKDHLSGMDPVIMNFITLPSNAL
jgi:hypothetical protein